MEKSETRPAYLNSHIKKVSDEELREALKKVREENARIRASYKTDKQTMSFRIGK